jgi:nucleoside phosphorylase
MNEPTSYEPKVHFGLVASGDIVKKCGEDRDQIAAKEQVIAFEMEGAGVSETLPCLIVKGVCDYADSHKSKRWQNYAAVSAAACMKAFLESWTTSSTEF